MIKAAFIRLPCLLFILLISTFFSSNAQDTSGYFDMGKPSSYPPYDSLEFKFERGSLMTGHLAHNLFFHSIQAQLLSIGHNKEWNFREILGAGTLASTPAIVNAISGNINPEGIWLKHHGTKMGFYYGYAAGHLIYGNRFNQFNEERLQISTYSSIGLGALGYFLGSRPGLDDNRVGFYQRYATLGTGTGFIFPRILKGNDVVEANMVFATSLAGAAGGYLYGHFRSTQMDLTRGDHVATTAFSYFHAYHASMLLIAAESDEPRTVAIPILTALGSAYLGEHWVRNARLSRIQSKGLSGILIGISGLHALFYVGNPPSSRIIPPIASSYILGMVGYKLALDNMVSNNRESRINGVQAHLSLSPVSAGLPSPKRFGNPASSLKRLRPGIRLKIGF